MLPLRRVNSRSGALLLGGPAVGIYVAPGTNRGREKKIQPKARKIDDNPHSLIVTVRGGRKHECARFECIQKKAGSCWLVLHSLAPSSPSLPLVRRVECRTPAGRSGSAG